MRSRIVACASALLLGAALCTSAVAQESAAEKKKSKEPMPWPNKMPVKSHTWLLDLST